MNLSSRAIYIRAIAKLAIELVCLYKDSEARFGAEAHAIDRPAFASVGS